MSKEKAIEHIKRNTIYLNKNKCISISGLPINHNSTAFEAVDMASEKPDLSDIWNQSAKRPYLTINDEFWMGGKMSLLNELESKGIITLNHIDETLLLRKRIIKKGILEKVFADSVTIEVPFVEGVTTKLLKNVCEKYEITVKKGKANYWFLTTEKSIDLFWLGCNIQNEFDGTNQWPAKKDHI